MEREVRYCTTEDGVRIAYTVEGQGPPLLVFPNVWTSFSLSHELPMYERLLHAMGAGRTLVRFDSRGTGLSQREIGDWAVTTEAVASDADAVMNDAGAGRVSVFANGPLAASALFFAATRGDRVAALAVFGAPVRVPDRTWYEAFIHMLRGNWELGSRALAGVHLRRSPDEAAVLASIYFRSTSGDTAARYMENSMDFDLTASFPDITARTLVIHSREDAMHPFSQAQEIAAGIKGARLLPLEGNRAATALGDKTDAVANAIAAFLDEDPETRAFPASEKAPSATTDGAVRTVLFTDLVGHTEMMSRLGDERGRAVLREHEDITRNVLKQHGGAEVKTMGDGFMASFASVTRAVECAIAIQRAFSDREGEPLSVRVGLNAGEPIEEDGDLFGATVILASRIAAKADGGEILVADTVRGLCSGKGFLFADRGEFVAKGFEDPVRIYEVSWRG